MSAARDNSASPAAAKKLKSFFGLNHIEYLMSQEPEVLLARTKALMQYESSLIGQVQEHERSSMSRRFLSVLDSKPKARPLTVSVPTLEGTKEKTSLSGSSKCRWP